MLQTLLDYLYPVRCPVCDEIVLPKGQRICKECREKLVYIREPRCKGCSKPIEYEEQEYCSDCRRKTFHYDGGYAVWVYNEAMRTSVAGFKYRGRKEYAVFYIRELVRLYGERIRKLSPDAIVPVPLHRSKYRERGYNQAEVLARGIGRELQLPVYSRLLVRDRKTLPQKKLSDKERRRNLTEAFRVGGHPSGKSPSVPERILLVDDIYTTGSTVDACSRILKAHGAKEVYFIVLCIGKGY
ncbi:ComF family protein [Anaerotaenia torta]|uniref:ComF family protein n=1 Tax=Anaerotaenia torta TaxID=433293 RepID=UPI003D22A7C2